MLLVYPFKQTRFALARLCYIFVILSFVASASSQKASDPEQRYKSVVMAWNDAHNEWKFKELEALYADRVLFYCSTIDKRECISYKTSLASPTKIFAQRIQSEINYLKLTEDIIKCEFKKQIIIDDKKAEYPAYIVLKVTGDSVKIICEGDEISDASFGFKLTPEVFNNQTGEPVNLEDGENNQSSFIIWFFAGASVFVIFIGLFFWMKKKRNQK